jgi:hypothetical protein
MIDWYGGAGGTTYFPYGFFRVVFTANGGTGQGFFEVSPGDNNRPMPFGSWLHFVMTYDGSNDANGIKFYINGELIPTQVRYNTTFVASLRNSTPVEIGHSVGYWQGWEDEVSIWDKELTQADVAEIYNNGDPAALSAHTSVANLVGWWRMGEAGDDGTMVNMEVTDIVGDSSTPFSRWSIPVGLDSYKNNAYANIGNVLNFDHNEPFSISLWFKTDHPFSSYILSKYDQTAKSGYAVWYSGVSRQIYFFFESSSSNGIQLRTTGSYGDGKWHHVMVTYNGNGSSSGFDIYVDDVLETLVIIKSNLLGNTTVNTNNLQIGARDDGLDYFHGVITEVAIYDTDLAAGDVSNVYNNGEPGNLSFLSSYADMVGWWRCGDGDVYPTLTDNSTNSNDATMVRAVRRDLIRDAPKSYTDHSSLFDGVSKCVIMGDVLDFERTDACSFSFWMKKTSGGGTVLSKFGAGSAYKGYRIYTGAYIRFTMSFNALGASNIMEVGTTVDPRDGQWHHVVVTKAAGVGLASEVTIYVDGISQSLVILSNTLTSNITNTTPFNIGREDRDGAPAAYMSGSLDEIGIYDKQLLLPEVQEIYSNGCVQF